MIKGWLRRLPDYPALRTAYHLLKGGEARNVALLRLRAPANLFQPYAATRAERYPALFRQVRALVGDGPDRRLLSFGCATGEPSAGGACAGWPTRAWPWPRPAMPRPNRPGITTPRWASPTPAAACTASKPERAP